MIHDPQPDQPMPSKDRRRIATAIAILLAAPAYVVCGLHHVCMDGHMKHPVYPPAHWLNDCFWLCAMSMAAVFCWKSNLRFKRSVFTGLMVLVSSRLLLGSGGSLLFLIEIPILSGVVLAALTGLKFPDRDKAGWSKEERSAHRRRIVRNWVIVAGTCAFTGLAIVAAIRIHDLIRKTSAPRIEINARAIPFKRGITLNYGEAVVLVLPDRKTLAVWCEKPSGIMQGIHGGGAGLEYGEQPFTPLERENIPLPDGGTTSGEYRSYIRQGPVMDPGIGKAKEYILYVNPYRISLDQQDDTNQLRLTATITRASEEEMVGPKDEVDYHARRLHDADDSVRMNAIFELEELLISGSVHAEPRKPFIIARLVAMENDPVADVREMAAESLRNLGDPSNLLKVVQPQPTGDFLMPEAARSLGSKTKECDSPAELEPLFRHVLTLLDSDQEKMREFAVNFFSGADPVEQARGRLLKAFSDPAPIVRAAALHALENLYDGNLRDRDRTNDHQARDVAIRMLADPAPEVVIAALETSIHRGETRIFPFDVVQPFLTSDHKGIRLAAIRALLFDLSDAAEQVLLDFTLDPDPEVRAAAAECLCDSNSEAVRKRMIQLLGDQDLMVRIRALQSLDCNRHPEAIPAIQSLLARERDPDVIRVANDALPDP